MARYGPTPARTSATMAFSHSSARRLLALPRGAPFNGTARSCSCDAPTEGGFTDAQEMLAPVVSFFVGRGESIVSPGTGSSSAPGTSTWRFGSATWSVAASSAAVRRRRGFRPATRHSFPSVLRRHAGYRRCVRSSSRRGSIRGRGNALPCYLVPTWRGDEPLAKVTDDVGGTFRSRPGLRPDAVRQWP